MKKLNKIIKLILLLIASNIISMEEPKGWQEQEQQGILNLPMEVLEQIVCPNLIKEIEIMRNKINLGEIQDIVDFYKYFNKKYIDDLLNARLTCPHFNERILGHIDRFRKLFKQLKEDAIKEYEGLSPKELTQMLKNKLNNINFNDITSKDISVINNFYLRLKEFCKLILAGADVNTQQRPFKWTTLMLAATQGYPEIIKLLLSIKSIDVKMQNIWGQTALIEATIGNRTEAAKLLLERPNTYINLQNNNDATALVIAASNDYNRMVKLLLDYGAAVNIQDDYGSTPLIHAASLGQTEAAKLLLENKNIDVNIQDNYGNTALTKAVTFGHIKISILLIEKPNINVNIQNKNGETALDIAKKNNHYDIAKLIESKLRK